ATEPHVTRSRVSVPVPQASVAHFETLDRTVRTALHMVDEGHFLTPPTQPELQALRAWLCGEVRRQSMGAAPTPWSSQQAQEVGFPHVLRWDTRRVDQAATGMIAADDADRIVAVSVPALDLLGYSAAAELVGTRLVSIIPERYRQAHLAGFTMHFLSGRAPLVDRTIVVPALRRDRTEVSVSLTIHRERSDDGRTVFVADLAPA
ncbi:MAG: PAS domain S-box protein, partial [Nocardioidaceae bacterium]